MLVNAWYVFKYLKKLDELYELSRREVSYFDDKFKSNLGSSEIYKLKKRKVPESIRFVGERKEE